MKYGGKTKDYWIYTGDSTRFLQKLEPDSVQLILTSPPYNIGKEYERRVSIDSYLSAMDLVVNECVRILKPGGSLVWQVGNYVTSGEVMPLDILMYQSFKMRGLTLRGRVVWTFEHGLHASRRLSGRYETALWFTKGGPDYLFNLDAIRIPQKYPEKRGYKGPRKGELTGNPLGKNPGDVWALGNVKSGHVEKTDHPCQFPIEFAERFIHATTKPGDIVVDPFLGSGTTVLAAYANSRKGYGSDIKPEYTSLAAKRLALLKKGKLPARKAGATVFMGGDANANH